MRWNENNKGKSTVSRCIQKGQFHPQYHPQYIFATERLPFTVQATLVLLRSECGSVGGALLLRSPQVSATGANSCASGVASNFRAWLYVTQRPNCEIDCKISIALKLAVTPVMQGNHVDKPLLSVCLARDTDVF